MFVSLATLFFETALYGLPPDSCHATTQSLGGLQCSLDSPFLFLMRRILFVNKKSMINLVSLFLETFVITSGEIVCALA